MKDHKNLRVLLVEDNEISQKVITMILTMYGCTTHVAGTGEQALHYFNQNDYELILMDIGLPDANGLAISEKIRNSNKKNKDVPIIILTAYSDEEYLKQSKSLNLNDYVTKPMTEEACLDILNKVIANRINDPNFNQVKAEGGANLCHAELSK